MDSYAKTAPSPSLLTISNKPSAPISHTFFPSPCSGTLSKLIIFINGLGLPATSWLSSISYLQAALSSSCPALLTFDRYSQGLTTNTDPLNNNQGYGHDFANAATDLHEIIIAIASLHFHLSRADIDAGKLGLLLVGNSIGVPIIRIYAGAHPGLVSGCVFLDSNICNTNYSTIIPSPSSPAFDSSFALGPDCTLEQYTEARAKLAAIFDLYVKNKECMDRRNGPTLLPNDDAPKMMGRGGEGVWLSVIGHDPEYFAVISERTMGTPKSMSEKFTNP